ncbi:MAG: efflux RND transporter periplasmic adaptor subunit [Desulfobacteraceae bacterium]|jgi:membrane fusion protein (multidrug efflux system)
MPLHQNLFHRLGPFLLSVAVLSLAAAAAAAPPGPGQGRPPVVTVLAVTEAEVNPPTEHVGRVEAIQAVDLRARVQGYLEAVKFNEGSDVRAGDLLFTIEQAPYLASVNAARAKVASAQAALTNASQYLRRLQAVRSGGVSASDLEAAVSNELKAQALLQEAQASLEQDELDLGYTIIRAPIGGRIGRTAFTKGNLVGPDSGALARIVQIDPIRVVYSVSENDYADVKTIHQDMSPEQLRQELVPRLKFSNGELYPRAGKLAFADNEVDADTGTIAVWAKFENPHGILLPGQYVTVLLSLSNPRRLPVVPQSAVQEDREGRYVFVVDGDNKVQQRRITTGAVVGVNWAVEAGLMAGETVIVQGVQKVRPGQVVETVFEGAQEKRG